MLIGKFELNALRRLSNLLKRYLISKRYHLKEARLPAAVREWSPRYRHNDTGLETPAGMEPKSENTRLFNYNFFENILKYSLTAKNSGV